MNQKALIIEAALEDANFPLALQHAKNWTQEEPENAEAKVAYGDVFQAMANYSMAIEQYQQALRINPTEHTAYAQSGLAYGELGHWKQAINSFKSACRIAPDNVLYTGYAGWALWNAGQENGSAIQREEARDLLMSAHSQGADKQEVKDALADAYLELATLNWPKHPESGEPLPTHLEHLAVAKKHLDNAQTVLDYNHVALKSRWDNIYDYVENMKKKAFYGYSYMMKAPIVVAVLSLLFGATGFAVFLLILAALYYFSQMQPGYLANRRHVKGNYGDPFWVSSINGIGAFFNQFGFIGSIGSVFSFSIIFLILGKIFQYSIAIFLLPFLILTGFVVNYDLLGLIKNEANKLNQKIQNNQNPS